jgi:hypothetical protein
VATGGQINLRPNFKSVQVPCEGTLGDLLVLTPLEEGDVDASPQGLASLWFCTKSSNVNESRPAIWKRVQFDGFSNCQMPDLPKPPQNQPPIREG